MFKNAMFKKMRNRILLVNMTIITALVGVLLAVIYLTTYNQMMADNQAELDHVSRWSIFATASVAGEVVGTGDFTISVARAAPRLSLPTIKGISSIAANRVFGRTSGAALSTFSFQAAPITAVSYFTTPAAAAGVTTQAMRTPPSMIRMTPAELSHSFHVIVDDDGKVVSINSYTGLTEEECSQAAVSVWTGGSGSGTYKTAGHTLMYTVQPLNPSYLVYELGNSSVFAQLQPSSHRITFLDVTASRSTLTQLLTTELIAAAVGLVFIFAISVFFANRSIAPIARSWDQQKQFVTDASHELKTPLAIIGANADALLANPGETVDSQRIWVDYIKGETSRMGRLVNGLLELAHTEAASAAAPEAFDLSELTADAVLTMEAVAFEKGLTLDADIAPGLQVTACREDMGRVLLILLDNAVKYTDPGGSIAVALAPERHHACLTVSNSGEGLPEDVLPRIFDRFYRADPARNQESGSFGLGLSIAKNIVEQAGGTIAADSSPGEGVTLTVTLPLHPA